MIGEGGTIQRRGLQSKRMSPGPRGPLGPRLRNTQHLALAIEIAPIVLPRSPCHQQTPFLLEIAAAEHVPIEHENVSTKSLKL
jgi:hypothetical protein